MNRASIDVVLASFDLLVLQANRGDSEDHAFAARSFAVNKLPLLLSSASAVAIIPLGMPLVLQQALGRVESTAPQRTAFLTACALHSLITEEDMESITGIRASAHQAGPPALHTSLLQQYKSNPQVVEEFIVALESLDGNAAAYAETIVDVRIALPDQVSHTDTILEQDRPKSLHQKAHHAAKGYLPQPCLKSASAGRDSCNGRRGSLNQSFVPALRCLATGCRPQ